MTPLRWDIFCQVIDNHGDLGVCWRLAADLASRGHTVRLWVDDASALTWMAPGGHPGVAVHPWPTQAPADGAGDVVIEAFGCAIAPEFEAVIARPTGPNGQKRQNRLWLNLEYLSAESYVERCHKLPSPVMSGPAKGCTRWFFYPGFTPRTGGLLREPSLFARQKQFDRRGWRARHGLAPGDVAVSLFCYEPAALPALLQQLAHLPHAHLLVTPGRAAAAVRALPNTCDIRFLPHCPQPAFDEMLWACDLNFVRGEDSLVRALWAGQPMVWQIYPQDDNAHHAKMQAFLDWLQAPESLRQFHAVWNGIETRALPELTPALLHDWAACMQKARARLLEQDDLVTQLIGFCAGLRTEKS